MLRDILTNGMGAFFGAVFAFFLFVFTDRLTRSRERQMKHYNALVLLEYALNDWMNLATETRRALSAFRVVVGAGAEFYLWPRTFRTDDALYASLLNGELINRVFRLNDNLNGVNHEYTRLKAAYARVLESRDAQRITEDSYRVQALNIADVVDVLAKHLLEIRGTMEPLVARIRVQARKDNPKTKTFWWTPTSNGVTEDEVQAELAILRREIEASLRTPPTEMPRVEK